MIFQREHSDEVDLRQLDLFAEDEADGMLAEVQEHERLYDRAAREDAEEAYGDYADAVEAVKDALAEHARPLRRHARRRRGRAVRGRLRRSGEEALALARIEDYALLGDLQTAALVERGGSIDWLCFPRFDSAACFAALLGTPENGRWLLAPAGRARNSRRYLHDTLVLETTWEAEDGGVARVIDFMPQRGTAPDIVRIVEGVKRARGLPLGTDDPVRLRECRPMGAPADARGEHANRDRGA